MLGMVKRFYSVTRERGGKHVVRTALNRSYWFIAGCILVERASDALRRSVPPASDIGALVDVALTFREKKIGIAPNQRKEEIEGLLNIISSAKPRVILEIGTSQGGTLFLFTRVASEDALLITIDLPSPPLGAGYLPWRAKLYRSFAIGGQELRLIRSDSHSAQTMSHVLGLLGARKVDVLFIDGDHSYEGVKKDFEMYSPLVAKDGIVAFHDIVPGRPEDVGGVPRFWNEVKVRFRSQEFVKSFDQGGSGIGVLSL
jgi:predicted O-methyltransferase YrrM